ncbi:MAG: DUF5011 domain-containing protein [Eggerthellaceae bacterium]|nr:DUF5011 domain-containing protein [Eggerthellaceae bacterium]
MKKKPLAILLTFALAVTMFTPLQAFAEEVVAPSADLVEYGDVVAADPSTAEAEGQAPQAGEFIEEEFDFGIYGENAEPAEAASIAIAPMAAAALPAGGVEVSSWAELIAAMNKKDVSYILFANSIQRDSATDLPAVSRSLTIDGAGFTLNFTKNVLAKNESATINKRGFALGTAPADGAFTLQNINIEKANVGTKRADNAYAHLITGDGTTAAKVLSASAGWNINLHNVAGTDVRCGLVYAPKATLNVTGTLNWDSRESDVQHVLWAQKFYFSGADTVATITAHRGLKTSCTSIINTSISLDLNLLSVTDGAKVYLSDLNTGDSNTVQMKVDKCSGTKTEKVNGKSVSTKVYTQVAISVAGAGSVLDVDGMATGCGVLGGTVVLEAAADNATVEVLAGAKMHIRSLRQATTSCNYGQPALLIHASGGKFIADGWGTEAVFESWGQADKYGATVRLEMGGQVFKATNGADITIYKHKHNGSAQAAALLFKGKGDRFIAESGATIHINNEGNSKVSCISGCGYNNAAIEFHGDKWGFDVNGWQTAIEIYADMGPAVDTTCDCNGYINMGPDSVFIAYGNVKSTCHGVFDTGCNFNFKATQPGYYDFCNTNPMAGARVFTTGTKSTFALIESDMSVWGNGYSREADKCCDKKKNNGTDDPIWGPPYRSWSNITLTLSGKNFKDGFSSPQSASGYLTKAVDNFGNQGTWPYRRICGNNAAPKIGDLYELTNADKYARATVTIPAGFDFAGRPVADGEVFGHFQISGIDGSSATGLASSLAEEAVYEVEQAGMFESVLRYDNGNLLRAGDAYQLTSAWRGTEDPASSGGRLATSDAVATVKDVLPPVPAAVNSANGKVWIGIDANLTGSWKAGAAQAAAEPHNPDPAVKLLVAVNSMDTVIAEGTLSADGTWSVALPKETTAALNGSDKVFFVLEDATGNRNPLVETPKHDTMMAPAPYLTAAEPDLVLSHKNSYIGLNKAKEIAALGQDSTGQLAELKDLIQAKAEKRTPDVTLGTGVSVTGVDPSWDVPAFYDLDAFAAGYPDGKSYTVAYAADEEPAFNNNGTVTVLPFDEASAYIGANNFTITKNNTLAMMNIPNDDFATIAARDARLIELARAQARLDVNDPWSPDLVEVFDVAFPSDPMPGDTFPVTFHVKGAPYDDDHMVTVMAAITSGSDPVLTVTTPIHVWMGDPAKRPDGSILPDEWTNNVMQGVRAHDGSGTDITGQVIYDDAMMAAVNLAKEGIYPVTYRVRNADGNWVEATRLIVVNNGNYAVEGDYVLYAENFLKTSPRDATPATILEDANAQAYLVDSTSPTGYAPDGATAEVLAYWDYGNPEKLGMHTILIGIVDQDMPQRSIAVMVLPGIG